MKNTLLSLLAFLFLNYPFLSQVGVGDFKLESESSMKLKEKTMERFNGKVTKFILPSAYTIDQYKEILQKVWTVGPFEVFHKEGFDESSVAVDDVIAMYREIINGPHNNPDLRGYFLFTVLDIEIIDELEAPNRYNGHMWKSSRIASIYFTPDIEMRKSTPFREKYKEQRTGQVLNFTLGYFQNFIQNINNSLKNNIEIDPTKDVVKAELGNLRTSTLYVDKSQIYGYDSWRIEEKPAPPIEELTKDFSSKFLVVDQSEIDNKIRKGDEKDFYYLMYSQINGLKIISVINGTTGDIVYQKNSNYSYNLDEDDFKDLSKAIQKAK